MIKMSYRYIFVFFFYMLIIGCGNNDVEIEEAHQELVMRQIGHEILMLSKDSTSLVYPIINNGGEYRIQFAAKFGFQPKELLHTIDSIIKKTPFSNHYLVQVEKCKTNEIVYSYETNLFSKTPLPDEVACALREQPKDCYDIVLHFITEDEQTTNPLLYLLFSVLIVAVIVYIYVKKKKTVNDNRIVIGSYLYDPKKMTLTLINNTIELTSKESELLNILNESVNETVERETLLNRVWGDEGDYVGRTLDVYISKLRKKLENDTSIEIKNIRGIGYKLIVE